MPSEVIKSGGVAAGSSATLLYFGYGSLVKFLVDKGVLPSPFTTTGLPGQNLSEYTTEEIRSGKASAKAYRQLEERIAEELAYQASQAVVEMPPMWNRDP